MATAFSAALATPHLALLFVGVFLAGLVRGFTGFGTSMVYMPFAGAVLPPVWAIITVVIFDAIGPLPNVPRALKDGQPREVFHLVAGAAVSLPFGLFVLARIDPDIFRWTVSLVSLLLLALLISGWRYHAVLSRRMVLAVGALGGFLSGTSGLAGPPVIMLYMSGTHAIEKVRANIFLYLMLVDVLAFGIMAATGLLALQPVLIGLMLFWPYMLANIIGAALFRPDRERIYRLLAYVLIAVAALSNLPLFG